MRCFSSLVFVFSVSIVFAPSVHAASSIPAAKSKPTYESCLDLVRRRGLGAGGMDARSRALRNDFINDCMAGKQK
jgi:hypothetical protein